MTPSASTRKQVLVFRELPPAQLAVEPLPQASPLRRHPRVTVLPHIGSATHETRLAMAEMAVSNLLQVLAGRPALARCV